MIQNYLASLLLCLSFFVHFQEVQKDSILVDKSTAIVTKREFKEDLKEKYTGKDFEYKENANEEIEQNKSYNLGILNFLIFFMSKIFPFLLGGFLLVVLLKLAFGLDVRFWKKQSSTKIQREKLVFEDDNIHEIDLEKLLNSALANQDFRLAIRYYYLLILKGLSNKKLIEYHKDKTNSEYVFELKREGLKKDFSKLSYIYAYVWYGEFPLDEKAFQRAEKKYQSFLTQLA